MFAEFDYTAGGGTIAADNASSRFTTGNIWYFLQSPCWLRIRSGGTNEAFVEVELSRDAGTAGVTLNMRYHPVQTVDLRSLARSVYARNASLPFGNKMTRGLLTIRSSNEQGGGLGSVSLNLFVIDGPAAPMLPYSGTPSLPALLPDTFLLPREYNAWQRSLFSARYIGNVTMFAAMDASFNDIQNARQTYFDYERLGSGECCGGRISQQAAWLAARSSDNVELLARVMFVGDDDCGDAALLLWYSPITGGYKSRMAALEQRSDEILESTPMVRDFTPCSMKRGTAGVYAAFHGLTRNDYEYYKDILYSDEVYLVNNGAVTRQPVTVSGSFVSKREDNGMVLQMNVTLNEIE